MKHLIASLAAAMVLVACGGGADDATPAAQALPLPQLQEGLYLGKNLYDIDAFGRSSSVLVLENQESWSLVPGVFFAHGTFGYTGATTTVTSTTTTGVTGTTTTVTASNTVTTFTDDKALVAFSSNELGELAMVLKAEILPAGDQVLAPAIPSHPEWTIPHVTAVTSATGYEYDKPARLEDISGTWGMVTVSTTGAVTGTFSGNCTLIWSLLSTSTVSLLLDQPLLSLITAGRHGVMRHEFAASSIDQTDIRGLVTTVHRSVVEAASL